MIQGRSFLHSAAEINLTMRLWVRCLALLNGLRSWHCHKLWCRLQTGSDLALLWLWCRPAAVALIRPLAWEPPYALGVALKRPKKKKKKKINRNEAICVINRKKKSKHPVHIMKGQARMDGRWDVWQQSHLHIISIPGDLSLGQIMCSHYNCLIMELMYHSKIHRHTENMIYCQASWFLSLVTPFTGWLSSFPAFPPWNHRRKGFAFL